MPRTQKTATRRVAKAPKPKTRTKLQIQTVHERMLNRIEREKANPVKLNPAEPRMKVEDAARYVGLNHWTLRRWAHEGRVKYLRLGRRLFIPTAECDRLLSEGLIY